MVPEHGWYDPHRIEQAAAHAQETDLQSQAQLKFGFAALLDHGALGAREGKKRLDLECHQLARQLFDAQMSLVNDTSLPLPKRGRITPMKRGSETLSITVRCEHWHRN